jgi:adenine C2-methylase RlmN of 23S rRNA A2503 and tRNA A37
MTKEQSIVLVSKQDRSVNFVLPNGQEARYVRRTDDYFIVYLSSHNGCNMSCRFCHLTQSAQTQFKEASVKEMFQQAKLVINHYKDVIAQGLQLPVKTIHFNWMARGEALASSVIKTKWEELSEGLYELAEKAGIENVKFKISTIMPKDKGLEVGSTNPLTWFFNKKHKPVFYYSLYSTDEQFRKKWIPKSINPSMALFLLNQWQIDSGANVVLHWAFIRGQNDSQKDIDEVLKLVKRSGLKTKFNLVRYNPWDASTSETELSVAEANFDKIAQTMELDGSRIVPRVGMDVKASCGVFVEI